MPTVMTVFGTRPEAIKMAPLALALKACPQLDSLVCVTGQHREMLDSVLAQFHITPDADLNIMEPRQTLTTITTKTLSGMDAVLAETKPDLVLVHGDTSTTFAGALSAFYRQIPVGHVEAGLRTYDPYSPFPEELNRQMTTRLASLHFCPTEANRQNLAREGVTQGVYVTGNTVIDAISHTVREGYQFEDAQLREALAKVGENRLIVVTAHRRENLSPDGDGSTPMHAVCHAFLDILAAHTDCHIILPMHKSPAVRDILIPILGGHPRIHLTEPAGAADLHNLMNRAYLVLTDSGGLQEEAPALGKPVLVLRRETERPEAIAAGTAALAGVERTRIYQMANALLSDRAAYEKMARAVNPYGDGQASRRIVEAVLHYFKLQASPPDTFGA